MTLTGRLAETKVDDLLTMVEEAARSTTEGVKRFVEPAPGTLRRATSRRHHIVFGRRGSGKSSLLRKAAADLTLDRRPIAYVNLEAFKGHSYPDVLLSVLISALQEFKVWLATAAVHPATKSSFWKALFGSRPNRASYNRNDAARLSDLLAVEIGHLRDELGRTDAAVLRVRTEDQTTERDGLELGVRIGNEAAAVRMGAGEERAVVESEQVEERYRRSKIDYLHRQVLQYQALFKQLADLSQGDAYLFLDDLYHIRRSDQASVVDYFHRIAKDHHLWLKVGTIRHRTRWYSHGDPPTGIKIGDDADEIDLDLTLEKYSLAKDFLLKILSNFAEAAGVTPLMAFMTDGAVDRLVLASGGVARDFLSIFRRSVNVARERAGRQQVDKVNVEDVNVAAGEYHSAKRGEFELDTSDDSASLAEQFQQLRAFCLDGNNTNCFLLDKEQSGPEVDMIHELVDLKLVHPAKSRVTVSGRRGKVYEAYMIDLSEYAGAPKRRELELIEFWKPPSEALRRVSLIYVPGVDVRG